MTGYLWRGSPELADLNRQITTRSAPDEPAELAGAPGRPVPADGFGHGTEAGMRKHYRRGEKPCEPCRLAGRAAQDKRIADNGGRNRDYAAEYARRVAREVARRRAQTEQE